MKKILAVLLSLSLVFSGLIFSAPKSVGADGEYNVINPNSPVSNDRKNTTYLTSNANTPVEGFCYIGGGFSNINAVNEALNNGNNMLGTTATTDEVALYVDMGSDFDVSYAKLYQGSTNNSFRDSYCKEYSIYVSTETVNKTNKGNITWVKAGECNNGTIYNGSSVYKTDASLSDQADTGDTINFTSTFNARSIKVVFEKDKCMGTGNSTGGGTTGTVSILSFRVYGVPHEEETSADTPTESSSEAPTVTTTQAPTTQSETIINSDGDETLYGSNSTNLAQGKNGYASSNDRQDKNYAVKVGNLTDGSDTSFIVTHSQDQSPWFAVDLGSVQDVNKIKIVPGGTGNYASSYPISYEIQVATNNIALGDNASGVAGLSWNTVKTVTGGTLSAQETTFAHQTTRWIRVKVNSHNTDYCSFEELYVYETNKSIPYEEPVEPTDVLFIGNSMTYYNNLPEVVKRLAAMRNINLNCTAATNGGKNLIYQSTASNVDTAIKVGGYEIVVIQDIVGSFDADNLQTGADALIAKIKQYNPDAQIVFYEPWPVRNSLTGASTLLPYFTHSYFKTARNAGATLAPAGEAFYEIFTENVVDGYAGDDKHPTRYGTFISASTVLYTLFPELSNNTYVAADQDTLDAALKVSAEATAGNLDTFDLSILNSIDDAGYKYAHAVATAMASDGSYTSVAGEYEDLEDIYNPNNLPAVTGTVVDSSLFTAANGDIAIGKTSTVSSVQGNNGATNGNDGAAGTRWESQHGVDPQMYTIDFGQATTFDKVGFIWEGAYAKRCVIQVSDDGENWTTIKCIKATSAQTVQVALDQAYTKRYVRMVGLTRGTSYGYSFYEMGVWATQDYTVEIDDEVVDIVTEGDQFTIPSTYEYGYMDENDNNKVYKPGTKVTVNKDLSLTAIKTVNVASAQNGASVRLVESNPGIAFEATAGINGDTPIFSSAFTYGMVIAPEDAFFGPLEETLETNGNRALTAEVRIQSADDFYNAETGTYRAGIMKIKEFNYNRSFISRAFIEIKYTDGSNRKVYSTHNSLSRSLAGVSDAIVNSGSYFDNLSADEKAAAIHFASYLD